MRKRLILLVLLISAFPQFLFELAFDKTGRALLRAITSGRVRAREHSEPDTKPFNVWWRDANGVVVSEGTVMVIGMLFWLSVLLTVIAFDALVRNPS